jgi:hypothetical protein
MLRVVRTGSVAAAKSLQKPADTGIPGAYTGPRGVSSMRPNAGRTRPNARFSAIIPVRCGRIFGPAAVPVATQGSLPPGASGKVAKIRVGPRPPASR